MWLRYVGFEFWSAIHHREREREPAPPYQCHCQAIASAYNGSTAFAIWRCTAVCSQWRCQCKGYMAGVSRVEKREHEKAEKQTTQDNFGELFTSNRIFRQKRKNQFRIKINIFFPLILRSPSLHTTTTPGNSTATLGVLRFSRPIGECSRKFCSFGQFGSIVCGCVCCSRDASVCLIDEIHLREKKKNQKTTKKTMDRPDEEGTV